MGVGAGAGAATVRVNAWVASGATPLVAVIMIGQDPALPSAGVPVIVALPSPLSVNETPDGRAPVLLNVGVGLPVVVTVNVFIAEPDVAEVLSAEVNTGAAVMPNVVTELETRLAT